MHNNNTNIGYVCLSQKLSQKSIVNSKSNLKNLDFTPKPQRQINFHSCMCMHMAITLISAILLLTSFVAEPSILLMIEKLKSG